MSHEPECTRYGFDQRDGDCICDIIRAAYQRGREDAAKAVEGLVRQQLGYSKTEWIDDDDYKFIAAARKDGEQA